MLCITCSQVLGLHLSDKLTTVVWDLVLRNHHRRKIWHRVGLTSVLRLLGDHLHVLLHLLLLQQLLLGRHIPSLRVNKLRHLAHRSDELVSRIHDIQINRELCLLLLAIDLL